MRLAPPLKPPSERLIKRTLPRMTLRLTTSAHQGSLQRPFTINRNCRKPARHLGQRPTPAVNNKTMQKTALLWHKQEVAEHLCVYKPAASFRERSALGTGRPNDRAEGNVGDPRDCGAEAERVGGHQHIHV